MVESSASADAGERVIGGEGNETASVRVCEREGVDCAGATKTQVWDGERGASQTPSTYMRAGSPPVPWTCSRRECGAQGRVRVEETRNCHLRRSHLDRAFPRAAAPSKRAHQERLAVP